MDEAHDADRGQRRSGTVTVLVTDSGARLVLTGEVDLASNAELNGAVEDLLKLRMPIEVHTRDVTYMDSSVMAIIARLAHGSDQRISMVDPPALVRYLLLVAELDDVVELVSRRPVPERTNDEVDGRLLQRRHDGCSCAACRSASTPAASGNPA